MTGKIILDAEAMQKKIADLDASLDGKPEEEMTDFELRFMELRDIEWTLLEMHAMIEGGEAREDYETIDASHHFTEIDYFLIQRIDRVQTQIESLFLLEELRDTMRYFDY